MFLVQAKLFLFWKVSRGAHRSGDDGEENEDGEELFGDEEEAKEEADAKAELLDFIKEAGDDAFRLPTEEKKLVVHQIYLYFRVELKRESGTKFDEIDWSSGEEFTEYDEKGECPVMISNFRASFTVTKLKETENSGTAANPEYLPGFNCHNQKLKGHIEDASQFTKFKVKSEKRRNSRDQGRKLMKHLHCWSVRSLLRDEKRWLRQRGFDRRLDGHDGGAEHEINHGSSQPVLTFRGESRSLREAPMKKMKRKLESNELDFDLEKSHDDLGEAVVERGDGDFTRA
ncbi:hypothetical protein Bca52824_019155 [Brassica carinata]|uniref:Uncharacterized protein n=1 Tax=Brassica carinata TaxID=52824 RepID=A0A8X7VRX0_BRACI|nr:hypothetical protein Bca52824_019155 [Brassica carinata]